MIEYTPRYKTRNEAIISELRTAAGATVLFDPKGAVRRKAAEISTAMALIHGGEWQVQVDHSVPLILIRPA